MAKRSRECLDCGADLTGKHGNVSRCRPCAVLRARSQQGVGIRNQPCDAERYGDCVPGRLKRGLCDIHYKRWRKTGDPAPAARIDHWSRYEVTDGGCWKWLGPIYANGYGHFPFTYSTPQRLAHRAYYEHFVGEIPDGLVLDHICRVRSCVNPDHLEPVTQRENLRRGIAARLGNRCAAGLHGMTEPGAWYVDSRTRTCRACKSIREKRGRERRKAG